MNSIRTNLIDNSKTKQIQIDKTTIAQFLMSPFGNNPMKKLFPLSLLLCAIFCSVGCRLLPDFSAGRLARVFPSKTSVGTDPFSEDGFQPDLTSQHKLVSSTSLAQHHAQETPPIPPHSNAGHAHVTAYTPETSNVKTAQTDLQMKRPSAPFLQTGYEASIQKMQPKANRFAKAEQHNPFANSGVQHASFHEPVEKSIKTHQPSAIQNTGIQNPFAADEMKHAHTEHSHSETTTSKKNPFDTTFDTTEQTETVQFPKRHQHKEESAETDQWRASGESRSFSTPTQQ